MIVISVRLIQLTISPVDTVIKVSMITIFFFLLKATPTYSGSVNIISIGILIRMSCVVNITSTHQFC